MSSISGLSNSVSIPSDLTPAQEEQVDEILGELSSGSITAAQAQADIASLGGSQQSGAQSGAGSDTSVATLSSTLGLTNDQESQIASIIQNAQNDGTSPSGVLSLIENVLSPAQQQKLAQILSPTYSSSGTQSTGGGPPLFNTTA